MMEVTPPERGPATSAQPRHAGSLPRTVRVDPRLTFHLTMLFAIVAGLLLSWLGSAFYRIETDSNLALMRASNERTLRLSALAVTESMAGAMSDLRYLGHHNELDGYLRQGNDAAALELAREYAALLKQKWHYDMIRFLDPDGRERVRVHRAPDGVRIASAEELQGKGSRYYFTAMTRLRANEIYVSPLDLNVEKGQVEQPLKPMIRFGMALFDPQGKRLGYVVINYRAENLLNKLRNLPDSGHGSWLLDARGDWLQGPAAGDAWAEQLPERRARAFSRLHPAAWETMRQQTSGTVTLDGATHLQFLRIYPLYSLSDTSDDVLLARPAAAESYYWYALSASPSTESAAGHVLASHNAIVGGITLALSLSVLVISAALAFAIARQRALAKTLEQAVDNVPVQIAYIDAGQRFRFNNRAYLDTYGMTPSDLYGKPVREILGEDRYQQVRPYLEQALSGKHQSFELHSDESPGPHDLSVAYVPDLAGSGRVLGVYALVTDISPSKAAEQRERGHLLQLARAARLSSVGEVVSEIAHQINQPLAAIALFSNAAQRTLESGGEQGKLREWMETINTQAKRASEVVLRLRRFAHCGEIRSTRLDLNSLVRETVALLESEARASQVAVMLDLAEPLPAVQAAGILMEQVIYNLVHNAIQSAAAVAPPGQVTILTHADASLVWVEVLDNGSEPVAEPTDGESRMGQSISRDIISSYQSELNYLRREAGNQVCFSLPRVDA